jgi:N-terminal domain of ribose phosphate pyrophosphokinase
MALINVTGSSTRALVVAMARGRGKIVGTTRSGLQCPSARLNIPRSSLSLAVVRSQPMSSSSGAESLSAVAASARNNANNTGRSLWNTTMAAMAAAAMMAFGYAYNANRRLSSPAQAEAEAMAVAVAAETAAATATTTTTAPAPPPHIINTEKDDSAEDNGEDEAKMTESEFHLEEATRRAKMHSGQLKIFSGNGNMSLAQEICRNLGVNLGKAIVGRFADGEVQVEIQENVRCLSCQKVSRCSGPRRSPGRGSMVSCHSFIAPGFLSLALSLSRLTKYHHHHMTTFNHP